MNISPLDKVLENPSNENKLELVNMMKGIAPSLLELGVLSKEEYDKTYSSQPLHNFINSDDTIIVVNFLKEISLHLIKFKTYHKQLKEYAKLRGII